MEIRIFSFVLLILMVLIDMKIVITSGGTIEKIDEVRHITNNSTGTLGCAIAESFLRFEEIEEIIYVCALTAVVPQNKDRIKVYRVAGVQDLQDTLSHVLSNDKIDGIVHCMAVSDYSVDTVTSTSLLISQIGSELSIPMDASVESKAEFSSLIDRCLHAKNAISASGKISSDMDDLIVVLKKTPKIISMFKPLQPQAILVGFKLLNNVTTDALIEAATHLMRSNGCDFVFANDIAELSPEYHCGYLLQSNGTYEKISGRVQITDTIASSVINEAIRRVKL